MQKPIRIEFSHRELKSMSDCLAHLPSARYFEGAMHRELCLSLRHSLFERLSNAGAKMFNEGKEHRKITLKIHELSVLAIALMNPSAPSDQAEAALSALSKIQPVLIAPNPQPRTR